MEKDKKVVEIVKRLIREQTQKAKEECFKLANPQNLDYEMLSSSEKALYDFCGYIDGYDTETLETLVEIINSIFLA